MGPTGADVPEPFEQMFEVRLNRIWIGCRQTEPFAPLPRRLATLIRGVEPNVLVYVPAEDRAELEKKAASSPSA
jgi:hypothetical protein